MQISDVISAVKALQAEQAQADLIKTPEADPAFLYGVARGKYLAFNMVLQRIEQVLEAEDRNERSREED